jgi:hypothetical protein
MSAAFVAVTPQVPTDVYERVAPVIEQPAVPAVVTAYVTAPVPVPPVVDRAWKVAGEVTVCPVKARVD